LIVLKYHRFEFDQIYQNFKIIQFEIYLKSMYFKYIDLKSKSKFKFKFPNATLATSKYYKSKEKKNCEHEMVEITQSQQIWEAFISIQ